MKISNVKVDSCREFNRSKNYALGNFALVLSRALKLELNIEKHHRIFQRQEPSFQARLFTNKPDYLINIWMFTALSTTLWGILTSLNKHFIRSTSVIIELQHYFIRFIWQMHSKVAVRILFFYFWIFEKNCQHQNICKTNTNKLNCRKPCLNLINIRMGTKKSVHISRLGTKKCIHTSRLGTKKCIHISRLGTKKWVHISRLETKKWVHISHLETKKSIHISRLETKKCVHISRLGTKKWVHISRLGTKKWVHISRLETKKCVHIKQTQTQTLNWC